MAEKHSALTVKLGKRLRELRISKKYTSQEAFADAAGLDRAGYGRIERGEVDPRLSTLNALAKALKVPLAELFSPKQTKR